MSKKSVSKRRIQSTRGAGGRIDEAVEKQEHEADNDTINNQQSNQGMELRNKQKTNRFRNQSDAESRKKKSIKESPSRAGAQQQDQPEEIRISWKMFEKSKNLGQGAFGDVLKVKCMRSTCLSRDGTCRIVMTQQSVKRAKQERQKAEVAAGRNAAIANDYEKSMFQDDYYVAKTINVAHLNQKAQFEALNEIETMQTLNSPYIVGYYDSFIDEEESEPQINIIIEYCSNGDLSTFLEKQERMQQGQAQKHSNENLVWRLFINICLGLEHMHSKGFIHRDLKTLNIFMTKDNVAKIGDLGCAVNLKKHKKLEESKKTEKQKKAVDGDRIMEDVEGCEEPDSLLNDKTLNDSMLLQSLKSTMKMHSKVDTVNDSSLSDDNPVGTPYYLSPEIWREKKYSKKSDIWALGVILYELLHFKKPFPANDKEELIHKVYNQSYQKVRAGVSQAFQHLVNVMLKKDPNKRPSVEEIILSDEFQSMAAKQKINLPLMLNKQKILQKIATDQLGDLQLTQYQKALFEKELKRAAKVVQKVEKQIQSKKMVGPGLINSRAKLHQKDKDEALSGSGNIKHLPQSSSAAAGVNSGKANKSNTPLVNQINHQSNSAVSFASSKRQQVPKLNLQSINFSENLKGEADILVIDEVPKITISSRKDTYRKGKHTQRSPLSGQKSVETKKKLQHDKSGSRQSSQQPHAAAAKADKSIEKQSAFSSRNISGGISGNKSEVFTRRNSSKHNIAQKVKQNLAAIEIKIRKGSETERMAEKSSKKDYLVSKPLNGKHAPNSNQNSPRKANANKTIFAMKVQNQHQKSTSGGKLSQQKSPRSDKKKEEPQTAVENVDESPLRSTVETQKLNQYDNMDIEEGGLRGNETILLKLSEDGDKRNRTEGASDEDLELRSPQVVVMESQAVQGLKQFNEQCAALRGKGDKSMSEDFDVQEKKSQTVIHRDHAESLTKSKEGKYPAHTSSMLKKKKDLSQKRPQQKARSGNRSQVMSTSPKSFQFTQQTNMNVDKRQYLSKFTESSGKPTNTSATPATSAMQSDHGKKPSLKAMPRKESTVAKHEAAKGKRRESVFTTTVASQSSPKTVTKKTDTGNSQMKTQPPSKAAITPSRRSDATVSTLQMATRNALAKKQSYDARCHDGSQLHQRAFNQYNQMLRDGKKPATSHRNTVNLPARTTGLKAQQSADWGQAKSLASKRQQKPGQDASTPGRYPQGPNAQRVLKGEKAKDDVDGKIGTQSSKDSRQQYLQSRVNSKRPTTELKQAPKHREQQSISKHLQRQVSMSSKSSCKNAKVPLKQDVFKKANLERKQLQQSERNDKHLQELGSKQLQKSATAVSPRPNEFAPHADDEKTYQAHTRSSAKIAFVKKDKDAKTPRSMMLNCSQLTQNLTTPTTSQKQQKDALCSPDIQTGTLKAPQSIMIPTDGSQQPRLGKEQSQALTPGGYGGFLYEKLQKQQSLPNPRQEVGSGPSTGKYQRKKTFAAFERFKNAFKISGKNGASSGPSRNGGADDDGNSPKKTVGEQLPAPEKATSPEQIEAKQPDSGQQTEDSKQTSGAAEVQVAEDGDLVAAHGITKAPGTPKRDSTRMSMQFPPQGENADMMQEDAFPEVVADVIPDEVMEADDAAVKKMEDGDDLEFQQLRRFSYVLDESPTFVKFD